MGKVSDGWFAGAPRKQDKNGNSIYVGDKVRTGDGREGVIKSFSGSGQAVIDFGSVKVSLSDLEVL